MPSPSPALRNDLTSPPRELAPRSPSRSEGRSPTWQPSIVPLTRNDHRISSCESQYAGRAIEDRIRQLPDLQHQNHQGLHAKEADGKCEPLPVVAAKIKSCFRPQENIGAARNKNCLSRSVDDLCILSPTTPFDFDVEHQIRQQSRPSESKLKIPNRQQSPSSHPVVGHFTNNTRSASDHMSPSRGPSPQLLSGSDVWTPTQQQSPSPQSRIDRKSPSREYSHRPPSRSDCQSPSRERENPYRPPSRSELWTPTVMPSPPLTLRNDHMSTSREPPPRHPSGSEGCSPTWQPLARNDHRIPFSESQYADRESTDRITQLPGHQPQNQQGLHVKRADGKYEPLVAAKIKARFRQQENIVRNRSGSVDELRLLRPTTPLDFDVDHQIRHQRRPSESELEIPSRQSSPSSRPVGGNQRNNSRRVSDHWRPSREPSPQPPLGNEVWTPARQQSPPCHSGSYNQVHPNEQPPRPPSDHWGYINEQPHLSPERSDFCTPSCHPSSLSVEGHLDNELNSRFGTPLENHKHQPFPSMDHIQILIPTRQPTATSRNESRHPNHQQLHSPLFMGNYDNEFSSPVNTSLENGVIQSQYRSQSRCDTSHRDAIQVWIPAREPAEQLDNLQARVKHQGVQLMFNITYMTDMENRNLSVAHQDQTKNKTYNVSPEETTESISIEAHKSSLGKEMTSVPPYSQMDYLSGPSDTNRFQDDMRRAEPERKPHASDGVEHESTTSKASKLFGVRLRHGDPEAGMSPTNGPFSKIRTTTPNSRRPPSWTESPEDGFSGSTCNHSAHYRDPLGRNSFYKSYV